MHPYGGRHMLIQRTAYLKRNHSHCLYINIPLREFTELYVYYISKYIYSSKTRIILKNCDVFCYGYEIRCDISYYMGVVKNVSSRGSLVSPDRAMCVRSHALPTRECAPAPRRPVVRTGTGACVREPLLPGTRRDALFNCVTCVRVVYYIPLQYYYFNDMCVSSPFNLYCTS